MNQDPKKEKFTTKEFFYDNSFEDYSKHKGFLKGELSFLPGVGKSSFSMNLLRSALEKGMNVVYINLEQ